MTQAEALRLIAYIDRIGTGAQLTAAMKADPPMFDVWFEMLERADAATARAAVQQLNGELDFWPPRPGQITRRAAELEDLARSKIVALPDPERLRNATPEELAVARRLPELRARIRRVAAGMDPDL